ncbi:MAG TPA: peptidylprolyl isomerase [Micropruina sp.]|nr:peptidylprolyl isomerase [Micropruina sp.]HMR22310.1 peptidylprolyl isomerase [Micropruina sp.]
MTRRIPLIAGAALLLAGCGTAVPAAQPPAPGTTACDYAVSGEPARAVEPPPAAASTVGVATVTLTMSGGTVTITGDRARTPCTLNSIESLAKQGFFDDTGCHRLADSGMHMVQCGDPAGTGRGGPGYRFADERDPGARYPAGTVAMANAGPNTNGSQFFIIYSGEAQLSPDYTVFGQVDEASLKVLRTMAAAGHDNGYGDGTGRPLGPFRIITASVG